jgi:diguanylate cyclase (GGDEF)-like protein
MVALAKQLTQVSEAFKVHENFCKAMLDAYVVIDSSGKPVHLNALFSQLVSKKSKQVLKAESLGELIQFKISNKDLGLQEILNCPTPMRFDEVHGTTDESEGLNLIMSVVPFFDESQVVIGAFIMIRDVTAESNLQGKFTVAQSKSITDPLTGLFTRGYFEDYLKVQTESLTALPEDSIKRSMAIVMLDIDFFKKVNDTYGHQAGDYVLKVTSDIMQNCFRKSDVICRFGGEEFLVILPNTDAKGAHFVTEKLRLQIEQTDYEYEGKVIPVTMSSGVAMVRVGKETYKETIARADASLYEAKRSGRNRVVVDEKVD